MQIKEAIVHQLVKERHRHGVGSVEIKPRSTVFEINDDLNALCQSALGFYGGKSNQIYGVLDNERAFVATLKNYKDQGLGFIDFSLDVVRKISLEMQDENFSTGGHVLFIRYENLGVDWLLIVNLKLRKGTAIDENLNIKGSDTLDVEHLHEAARIDLDKWMSDTQPYLSFIKGRSPNEVTRYFVKALGCTQFTDSKKNTQALKEAFEAFVEHKEWGSDERVIRLERLYNYCQERHKAKQNVELNQLSSALDHEAPGEFIGYIREKNLSVSDDFKADPTQIRRLVNFRKRIGTVTIGFTVNDLRDKRVDLTEDGSLIIKNIPSDFKEEINRAKQ